jgi:hypothetical protein
MLSNSSISRFPRGSLAAFCARSALSLSVSVLSIAQTTTITGKVVNAATSSPITHALITARCLAPPRGFGPSLDAYSDAEGKFAFTGLPDDFEYSCHAYSVEADGYQTNSRIPLGGSEPLTIRLVPEALISGKVLNENGEGISGLSVALWARDGVVDDGGYRVGQKVFRTSDGGAFLVGKLPPGRYLVCALPDINAPRQDDRTYYPVTCSSPDREKPKWIELKAGESRDLTLQIIPRQGVIVSGKVTNPERGMIFFISSGSHGFLANSGFLGVAEKWNWNTGEFEHHNLPPGEYYVGAGSQDNKRVAVKIVEVGSEDIGALQLTLRPLPVLAGRFHTDDGSPLPPLGSYNGLSLDFEGGTITPSVAISKDGVFRTELRLPGRYQLNAFGAVAIDASGWWNIKSATQEGRDVLMGDIIVGAEDPAPIDVILTRENGSLEATVKAESDNKDGMITVALRRFGGRLRWVANSGPIMRLEKAPAGQYLLFARSYQCELRPEDLKDPEFLERYKQYGAEAVVGNGGLTRVEIQPIPCLP